MVLQITYEGSKPGGSDCVYLEVPQLSELLPAILEFTEERFDLFVHNLVGTDVSSLRKSFTAVVARIRTLSGMTTFMRLQPDCQHHPSDCRICLSLP